LIEDSYRWIFQDDHFKKWYEQDYPLLWLSGDPGKGKTMSICGAINHLSLISNLAKQDSNTYLSYFFCDATDSKLNNATSVLRGIVYSIIFQNSMALSYIRERYKDLAKPLSDPRLAWPVLQRLFIGIVGGNYGQKTYVIIDALDECQEDRDKLLEFIVKQASLLPVKWLVSSRNWPTIKENLTACPNMLELRFEDNETDISVAVGLYITRQLENLSTIKRYDQKRKEAVEIHLLSKARGTFLWVSFVFRMLRQIPAWQTMKRLDNFPAGLDTLYGRMLEQIQPSPSQERDPAFDELYARIVSFALTAFRPLSVDELYPLVDDEDITVKELEDIIALCGSFLTVKHRVVDFIHDSAKSYLLNEANGFKFDPQQQHAVLFSQSLSNLSRSLHRDMLHMESDHPLTVQGALGPIMYQCTHWISHLAGCESSTITHELMDGSLVDSFLRQNFLFWVEVLGHLKSVSLGISAMWKLDQMLHDHTSLLKDLVQDQLRYLRYHQFVIEQCPLQVYYFREFNPYRCIPTEIYESESPDRFTLPHRVHDAVTHAS
jgi:hypothetical protein